MTPTTIFIIEKIVALGYYWDNEKNKYRYNHLVCYTF